MSPSRKSMEPRARDDGYSLTELLIAMFIFGLLMSFTFTILIQVMYQSRDTLARSRALEEARLGVAQIDRQVRSGNVILDPYLENETTSGVPRYFSMRIYTQADENPTCAQWRVILQPGNLYGNLEFRSWAPGYPDVNIVQPWAVVAHDLVLMDVTPHVPDDIKPDRPETWPPFWVDSQATGGTQAQFVRVTLRLRDPEQRVGAKATSVTTVITGRNTVFGYPAGSCSQAPPP